MTPHSKADSCCCMWVPRLSLALFEGLIGGYETIGLRECCLILKDTVSLEIWVWKGRYWNPACCRHRPLIPLHPDWFASSAVVKGWAVAWMIHLSDPPQPFSSHSCTQSHVASYFWALPLGKEISLNILAPSSLPGIICFRACCFQTGLLIFV